MPIKPNQIFTFQKLEQVYFSFEMMLSVPLCIMVTFPLNMTFQIIVVLQKELQNNKFMVTDDRNSLISEAVS